MDYAIRRNPRELDSTGYIEIGPGSYAGKHWQDGFIFVWEDAFGMAEGILSRHMPAYDHFGMNDIPRDIGLTVIADWRNAADFLGDLSPTEIHTALNLAASYHEQLESEIETHRVEIARLLRELADECEGFYRRSEWICVLGM